MNIPSKLEIMWKTLFLSSIFLLLAGTQKANALCYDSHPLYGATGTICNLVAYMSISQIWGAPGGTTCMGNVYVAYGNYNLCLGTTINDQSYCSGCSYGWCYYIVQGQTSFTSSTPGVEPSFYTNYGPLSLYQFCYHCY